MSRRLAIMSASTFCFLLVYGMSSATATSTASISATQSTATVVTGTHRKPSTSWRAASSFRPERTLYVDANVDYKKNHIDDEINYAFHYYIGNSASMVHVNHREERHGAKVNGQYGLVQPDGYVRNVYYEVDGNKGFRSVVHTRTAHSRQHHVFEMLRRGQPTTTQPQAPWHGWYASKPVRHAEPVAYII